MWYRCPKNHQPSGGNDDSTTTDLEGHRLSDHEIQLDLVVPVRAVHGRRLPTGDRQPRQPHPFPPADEWNYTQHHPFRDSYDSNQRSVYLMMARLNARPFFTALDGADQNASTSVRDSSVTTVQSLYLMNDAFVYDRAGKLASRLMEASDDRDRRLSYAYELIVGRPPSDAERQNVTQWMRLMHDELKGSESATIVREQEIWAAFSRSMLRTNEFLYVD